MICWFCRKELNESEEHTKLEPKAGVDLPAIYAHWPCWRKWSGE